MIKSLYQPFISLVSKIDPRRNSRKNIPFPNPNPIPSNIHRSPKLPHDTHPRSSEGGRAQLIRVSVLNFKVECKKAQPKEVMLPANLAKTRAANRGAYGELVMVATPTPTTYRYAPYPLPTAAAAAAHAAAAASAGTPHHHLLTPIVATAAPNAAATYQYATGATAPAAAAAATTAAVYDVKRALAAAAAASYRPHPVAAAAASRAATLTYSMSDLLGIQGLDMGAVYHPIPTIGL